MRPSPMRSKIETLVPEENEPAMKAGPSKHPSKLSYRYLKSRSPVRSGTPDKPSRSRSREHSGDSDGTGTKRGTACEGTTLPAGRLADPSELKNVTEILNTNYTSRESTSKQLDNGDGSSMYVG